MTEDLSIENQIKSTSEDASFPDAIRFLESRINFEKMHSFTVSDLGYRLSELKNLLVFLGNPGQKFKTVHVAGTKGKGSTCAMLDAILLESGYRVGRFTSPHLYSVRERLLIDGIPCDESDFARLLFELRDRIDEFDAGLTERLSYFELLTFLAFVYFAEKQVDVAVLEVGMGGRLDATNICSPCLTIISSISFDHMEQLGPTLGEIAAEKGGIVKAGIPLISGVTQPEPKIVLQKIAEERNAPAFFLSDSYDVHSSESPNDETDGGTLAKTFCFQTKEGKFPEQASIERLRTSLSGTHQRDNAAQAVAAALFLRKCERFSIPDDAIRRGLAKVFIPIRVEIIRPRPDGPVFVVDGAHNRSSVKALMETIRVELPNRRYTVLFGASLGKDIEGMLAELIPNIDRIVFTQYSLNPRSFPAQGLKAICCSNPGIPEDIQRDFWFPPEQIEEEFRLRFSVLTGNHPIESPLQSAAHCIEIEVEENACLALKNLWREADSGDVVCVTGSMFLAAELRAFFMQKLSPSKC